MKKIAAVVLAALLFSAAAIPSYADNSDLHSFTATRTDPYFSYTFEKYSPVISGQIMNSIVVDVPHDYFLQINAGLKKILISEDGNPALSVPTMADVGTPIKDSSIFTADEKYHLFMRYSGVSQPCFMSCSIYYSFKALPDDAVVSSFSCNVMLPEYSNYYPGLPAGLAQDKFDAVSGTKAYVSILTDSGDVDTLLLDSTFSNLSYQTIAGNRYNIWTLTFPLAEPQKVKDLRLQVPVWWHLQSGFAQSFYFGVSTPIVYYSAKNTDLLIDSISAAAQKQIDYLDTELSQYVQKQNQVASVNNDLNDSIDQLSDIENQYSADASNLDFSLLAGSEFQKNASLYRRAFDSLGIFVTVPICMSIGIVSLVIFGKKG